MRDSMSAPSLAKAIEQQLIDADQLSSFGELEYAAVAKFLKVGGETLAPAVREVKLQELSGKSLLDLPTSKYSETLGLKTLPQQRLLQQLVAAIREMSTSFSVSAPAIKRATEEPSLSCPGREPRSAKYTPEQEDVNPVAFLSRKRLHVAGLRRGTAKPPQTPSRVPLQLPALRKEDVAKKTEAAQDKQRVSVSLEAGIRPECAGTGRGKRLSTENVAARKRKSLESMREKEMAVQNENAKKTGGSTEAVATSRNEKGASKAEETVKPFQTPTRKDAEEKANAAKARAERSLMERLQGVKAASSGTKKDESKRLIYICGERAGLQKKGKDGGPEERRKAKARGQLEEGEEAEEKQASGLVTERGMKTPGGHTRKDATQEKAAKKEATRANVCNEKDSKKVLPMKGRGHETEKIGDKPEETRGDAKRAEESGGKQMSPGEEKKERGVKNKDETCTLSKGKTAERGAQGLSRKLKRERETETEEKVVFTENLRKRGKGSGRSGWAVKREGEKIEGKVTKETKPGAPKKADEAKTKRKLETKQKGKTRGKTGTKREEASEGILSCSGSAKNATGEDLADLCCRVCCTLPDASMRFERNPEDLETITHLVVPRDQERPTLKVLFVLATGGHIVNPQFVRTADERETWPRTTAPFESYHFPTRVHRKAIPPPLKGKRIAVAGVFPRACASKGTLTKPLLCRLIHLCGGVLLEPSDRVPSSPEFLVCPADFCAKAAERGEKNAEESGKDTGEAGPDEPDAVAVDVVTVHWVVESLRTWKMEPANIHNHPHASAIRRFFAFSPRPPRVVKAETEPKKETEMQKESTQVPEKESEKGRVEAAKKRNEEGANRAQVKGQAKGQVEEAKKIKATETEEGQVKGKAKGRVRETKKEQETEMKEIRAEETTHMRDKGTKRRQVKAIETEEQVGFDQEAKACHHTENLVQKRNTAKSCKNSDQQGEKDAEKKTARTPGKDRKRANGQGQGKDEHREKDKSESRFTAKQTVATTGRPCSGSRQEEQGHKEITQHEETDLQIEEENKEQAAKKNRGREGPPSRSRYGKGRVERNADAKQHVGGKRRVKTKEEDEQMPSNGETKRNERDRKKKSQKRELEKREDEDLWTRVGDSEVEEMENEGDVRKKRRIAAVDSDREEEKQTPQSSAGKEVKKAEKERAHADEEHEEDDGSEAEKEDEDSEEEYSCIEEEASEEEEEGLEEEEAEAWEDEGGDSNRRVRIRKGRNQQVRRSDVQGETAAAKEGRKRGTGLVSSALSEKLLGRQKADVTLFPSEAKTGSGDQEVDDLEMGEEKRTRENKELVVWRGSQGARKEVGETGKIQSPRAISAEVQSERMAMREDGVEAEKEARVDTTETVFSNSQVEEEKGARKPSQPDKVERSEADNVEHEEPKCDADALSHDDIATNSRRTVQAKEDRARTREAQEESYLENDSARHEAVHEEHQNSREERGEEQEESWSADDAMANEENGSNYSDEFELGPSQLAHFHLPDFGSSDSEDDQEEEGDEEERKEIDGEESEEEEREMTDVEEGQNSGKQSVAGEEREDGHETATDLSAEEQEARREHSPSPKHSHTHTSLPFCASQLKSSKESHDSVALFPDSQNSQAESDRAHSKSSHAFSPNATGTHRELCEEAFWDNDENVRPPFSG
ncbi:hypothetical protein TGDOM2_258480 [Toxoplasma gondii GAB2-2007-GAL-DOM2]|uniref:BRCT domain-containing protein n=6 Tax=Toxoplasma gondii TaxID=5811 RepID=S7UZ70_TOXGG|nr:hypothetical protein TGGT1_258480 [Toxoplasma gondii GT1]KAF4641350.1 hypothetical protein TGRH88_071600 [Toxoplasma gondii]KFG33814.1 hypothetical protein TGDOM2_258480 [Toxoplasma gondii GAB2-2007-GAL-DOM2]KFG38010.1 hypothetical protein TGFOU_258480 [Toxoplasma gondii FOU]PUA84202.1 hypothetical protein TGBR9_258480 [Toxoplasma gondii TgCATBr9]RQX71128.1 hypothetical protein TGCAST_258480 [Toxoplasma gondii CAST]